MRTPISLLYGELVIRVASSSLISIFSKSQLPLCEFSFLFSCVRPLPFYFYNFLHITSFGYFFFFFCSSYPLQAIDFRPFPFSSISIYGYKVPSKCYYSCILQMLLCCIFITIQITMFYAFSCDSFPLAHGLYFIFK